MRYLRLPLVAVLIALGAVFATVPGPALGASYVVDTLADDPALTACTVAANDCSLRGAILNANGNAGTDSIGFTVGMGTPTINVGSLGAGALPDITGPTSIDGGAFGGATRIELNGAAAGAGADGIRINTSGGVTISRLVINRFSGDGIEVQASAGTANTFLNSYIGTDSTGTIDLGNGAAGIRINGATANIIGNPSTSLRNVISGNGGSGIVLTTSGNYVTGNYIGVTSSGNALGNSGDGVLVQGTGGNCIGGTLQGGTCAFAAGSGNTISANGSDGIDIPAGSDGNKVWANSIGTGPGGSVDVGNVAAGVLVESDNNDIGGNVAGTRNVISGNHDGVVLYNGASGNVVRQNSIGTNTSGTTDIGNDAAGVNLSHFFTAAGPTGNTIGGGGGEGNIISGNGVVNVFIADATTTGNTIRGNSIGPDGNGAGGAIVNGVGVIVAAGADNNTIGPSNLIGFNTNGVEITGSDTNGTVVAGNSIGTVGGGGAARPNSQNGVLVSDASGNTIGGTATGTADDNHIAFNSSDGVRVSGATATGNLIRGNSIHTNGGLGINNESGGNTELAPPVITGIGPMTGTACANCTVDIFSDDVDEGRFPHISVTADSSGNWSTFFTPPGPRATATATNAANNTSEFSAPLLTNAIVDTTSDANLTGCTSTPDDCSLRGAIGLSNSTPGTQSITFNILPAGPKTITPTSAALPAISAPVTINGRTQPGYAGAPIMELRGGAPAAGQKGLVFSGGGGVLVGFVINGWAEDGVEISGNNNVIEGNHIGTNVAGNAAGPGNGRGLDISGSANVIGGTPVSARNIVSGNTGLGVFINGSNNNMRGNYVGTNAAGTAAVPNGDGVVITGPGTRNNVGGPAAAERNVISGNSGDGVELQAGGSLHQIRGNYIGADVTGTADLGNGGSGVRLTGGSDSCIGASLLGVTCTPVAGARNVISGNNHGVQISGGGINNRVLANFIGTNAAGNAGLGNTVHGVLLETTNDQTIGGTVAGAGNTIAFNGGDGVRVSIGIRNAIRGNSIHSNGGLGIDTVLGGNEGLAPPVIAAVGSASGTACANCTVDVYSDSGDEGRVYHGSATADAGGAWSFTGPVTGPNVTATATNAGGSTSEFSGPFSCAGVADSDGDTICNSGDNCPSVVNTNQGNLDGDAQGDACDPEDDGDGFSDIVEFGAPLCGANVNHDEAFDAGDTLVNDGCPAVGAAESGVDCTDTTDNDADGAFNDGCPQTGSFSEAQFKIGMGSLDPCGNNGWPLELVTTGSSANKFDTVDLASFVAPVRRMGKNPGQAGFSSRWDLVPGTTFGTWINIADLAASVSGPTGFPPMLGGAKAINQTCPFPP